MAERNWIANTTGDWFSAANWTTAPPDPNNYPQAGDTVGIGSGTAIISAADEALGPISDETITLGGSTGTGTAVSLEADGATFTRVSLTVADNAGSYADPMRAVFLTTGETTFAGQISVEPHGGSLTIDAKDHLTIEVGSGPGSGSGSLIYDTQESSLFLTGDQLTNDALIQIEGAGDVAAGLSVTGGGTFEVDNGGRLSIEGAIGSAQEIALPDGKATVTLNDPAAFSGAIGLAQYGGARIDLPGLTAGSLGFNNGELDVYAGVGETGAVLAQIPVQLITSEDLVPLPGDQQTLTAADFTLGDDGHGGSRITYTPQGPTYLEASLPVPIVAAAGTLVPLSDILQQSFGTPTPAFYGMTLLPTTVDPGASAYWGQPPNGKAVAPEWYVNGQVVTTPTAVQPGDDVELLAGNNIHDPATIQMQVTPSATGTDAEYVVYDAWTTDPAVEQGVVASGMVPGKPTVADVAAAANAYNTVYPGVLNSDLCNWIADDVTAAAGVPLPQPNAQLDPSLNVEGGFWRVAYRGSASAAPVQDWGALVQPGDVVRMEWNNGGGHTTTVLGAVDSAGQITVYDNDDINADGEHTIGIHDASYWKATDPTGITIYRLDPDQQYLITGTARGEFIQGSPFDNLIRPGGGGDTITAGAADNEIQDTAAHLDGITVTDFHPGDTLDFTDLDPSVTTVSYRVTGADSGTLQVLSDGKQQASVKLPCLSADDYFTVGSDSSGGTLVGLVSVGSATAAAGSAGAAPGTASTSLAQLAAQLSRSPGSVGDLLPANASTVAAATVSGSYTPPGGGAAVSLASIVQTLGHCVPAGVTNNG